MLDELVACGNPKIIETINHQKRSINKDWLKAIKKVDKHFCAWCGVVELPKGKKKYCSEACADSSTAYCYPQSSGTAFNILFQRQNGKCAHCDFKYDEAIIEDFQRGLRHKRKDILRMINYIKVEAPALKQAHKDLKTSGVFNLDGYGVNGKHYYRSRLPEIEEIRRQIKRCKTDITYYLGRYFQFKKNGPDFTNVTGDSIRWFHRKRKDHKEPEIDHIIPVALNGMSIGLENVQILCYGCHKIKTKKDMVEIRNLKRTLVVEIR